LTDLISAGAAAFALSAGALAAFNPCAFALLPAYLTVIVTGSADEGVTRAQALRRAVSFGLAMTLGFILLFGIFGSILAPFHTAILPVLGWVTVVIGVALIALAIYVLRGGELKGPGLNFKGTAPRKSFWSQVLYGVSFALASLSCTIGVFLAVFAAALREDNYVGVGLAFVLYGVGMGGVVIVLSIIAASAGSAAVAALRRHTRHIARVAGVLLLIAGAYVLYYGIGELRLLFGASIGGDAVLTGASEIQSWLVVNVDKIPTWGIVGLGVVAAAAVAWVFLSRRAGDDVPAAGAPVDDPAAKATRSKKAADGTEVVPPAKNKNLADKIK